MKFQRKIKKKLSVKLPTQDKLWEMSEEYSNKCGLQNFFDEDEITIIRGHWCNGFTLALQKYVKDK